MIGSKRPLFRIKSRLLLVSHAYTAYTDTHRQQSRFGSSPFWCDLQESRQFLHVTWGVHDEFLGHVYLDANILEYPVQQSDPVDILKTKETGYEIF